MAVGNYTTVSRTKMLEYLKNNSDKTVNAQELNHYLSENGYGVNASTVYRYLDKLTRDGSLLKYTSEDGSQAVYQYVEKDSDCHGHLHLQCTKCGTIIHLDCQAMEEFANHVKNEHSFQIQCRNSVIFGICDKCR